ncbi:hypothetical protein D3C85_1282560 [compost metagenome]
MLWSAREATRVLLLTLQQANNSVDLAPDAIVGDNRLLATVQRLDLFSGPLRAVIIAPCVLLFLDLLVLRLKIRQVLTLQAGVINLCRSRWALRRSATLDVSGLIDHQYVIQSLASEAGCLAV